MFLDEIPFLNMKHFLSYIAGIYKWMCAFHRFFICDYFKWWTVTVEKYWETYEHLKILPKIQHVATIYVTTLY